MPIAEPYLSIGFGYSNERAKGSGMGLGHLKGRREVVRAWWGRCEPGLWVCIPTIYIEPCLGTYFGSVTT